MRTYEPAVFKQLAAQLRFSLTDSEAEDIANEFGVLIDQMALLDKVDTDGVEPMVYPFEQPTAFLREDVVGHTLSAEEALLNAPASKNGFFVTRKVVG